MEDRLIETDEQAQVLDGADVQVSTHLWYVWTEIALEHEWLARRARRAYTAAPDHVFHLEDEMKASLVVVTGVTHCLDALQRETAELAVHSQETVGKSRRPDGPAHAAVFRTLSETFGSPDLGPEVAPQLKELYVLRNEVVHHRAAAGLIVKHPALGMRTTPAAARYTLERASASIDLLFRILQAIVRETPDQLAPARAWATLWRHSVEELSSRRGLKPGWMETSPS